MTLKLDLTGVTKKGVIADLDGAMPRDVHTNAFPWTLQGKELRKRDILNIPLCLNTREMSRLRLIRLLCFPLMKPHLDFRPAVGDL